jgi:hypothetical protein
MPKYRVKSGNTSGEAVRRYHLQPWRRAVSIPAAARVFQYAGRQIHLVQAQDARHNLMTWECCKHENP